MSGVCLQWPADSLLYCRYYNAVIDMISDDNGTCSVTFEGYGTTEIVKVYTYSRAGGVLGYFVAVQLSELRPENTVEETGGKRRGAQQLMKSKANKCVHNMYFDVYVALILV